MGIVSYIIDRIGLDTRNKINKVYSKTITHLTVPYANTEVCIPTTNLFMVVVVSYLTLTTLVAPNA